MIDAIVVNSYGAYTHEQVFNMSLDFTYKLTMLHYEKTAYKQREFEVEREINKTV